jgi:hypothetical protein
VGPQFPLGADSDRLSGTPSFRQRRYGTLCIYAMRYEWDEAKNLRNQRRHDGISFELAALVFEDEYCLVYPDRIDCKSEEQRWHAVGAARIEA